MNVRFENGSWIVRGKNVGRQLIGRSSFKTANLLSMHFAGKGDEYPGGAMNAVKRWIEHNQKLFGREHVVLRVFGETGGWTPIPAGSGMFGSPANDQGIHDVNWYRDLCRTGSRVTALGGLHKAVLAEAFKLSDETGVIWEWPIIATLKHTDGLCQGVCDHVIRQTAEEMREIGKGFLGAAFICSAINEWDAHNKVGYTLSQINQLAARWYRWVSPDGTKKAISFTAPGPGWEPEQFPEAMLIVDHGGKDAFDYDCGQEAGKFQMGAVHPERRGVAGREWYQLPPSFFKRLRDDARGAPIGATESMYFVSKAGTEGWYRGPDGWNSDRLRQIEFYNNACFGAHPNCFDYFIVHDDIGAQSDAAFNPGSLWEDSLATMFDGDSGPLPNPEPTPKRLTFERVINQAYQEILGRDADPSGLAHYDEEMRDGMSEAYLREMLLRSPEFEEKNTR